MDRIVHAIDDTKKLTATRLEVATLATIGQQDAPDCNRTGFRHQDEERSTFGGNWRGGVSSTDEGRALFATGWQDGADRAELLAPQLANAIPAGSITRRRRSTGEDGEELRLDAVLAGNWDHAYTRREAVRVDDPAVISLSVGWIASAAVDHENLIWNALQAIVLADALEQAGYRVELRAIDGTTTYNSHNYRQLIDMTMKRAEEPLRADLIAATIGHGGVYRTLGFLAMWCVPKQQQHGLGRCFRPKDTKDAIADAIAAGMIPPVSYVLPRADTMEQAQANIREAVAALFPDRSATV
jgi:hypothetical protein